MCKVCVCWWKNASLRITDCCSAYYITITLLHSLQRKGCIYLYVYCEGKIFFLQWSHNTVNSRYSNRKVNAYTALYKFCSSTPSKTHVQQYATVHHRKTTELGGHPVASFAFTQFTEHIHLLYTLLSSSCTSPHILLTILTITAQLTITQLVARLAS